jgi:hypothetical protein
MDSVKKREYEPAVGVEEDRGDTGCHCLCWAATKRHHALDGMTGKEGGVQVVSLPCSLTKATLLYPGPFV